MQLHFVHAARFGAAIIGGRVMGFIRRRIVAILALGMASFLQVVSAAPLTLAIADLPVFSVALVAEDQGFFAAEGLDLKVIHCVNGKRCLKHLTDGEAHYATVADTPLVFAALAGSKFHILATIAGSARDNRFLARTDRGIRTAADLKGKRIGVVQGTTAHYFADTMLLFNGIAMSEVTLVPLDGADPAGALIRGDVDAAALYNPFGVRAQVAVGKLLVKLQSPSTFNITANLVGLPRVTGGKSSDVIKLLRALKKAADFIEREPARARLAVATRLRIASPELESMWGDYDFALSMSQTLVYSLEAQTRWVIREGLVPGARMPDYLDFVDLEPLRSVDAKAATLIK
jgi:ABC-type nitrate/sulfonate/bicarbonate transport system substrate-binding protein